jgi:hypothetical protein
MKRIIISSMLVLGVVTATAGATKAVFSDTASIAGNTISTGTLKIDVNNRVGKPIQITSMKPGDTSDWAWVDVQNVGTIPAMYYFYLGDAVNTNDPAWKLWGSLQLELRTAGEGATGADRCNNGRQIYLDDLDTVYGETKKINTTDFMYNQSNYALPAGWSQRICQRFVLPSDTNNDAQGKEIGFTEWFYAVQP